MREKVIKNNAKTKVNEIKINKTNKSVKEIDCTDKNCEENNIENTVKTRSGRVVKKPVFH